MTEDLSRRVGQPTHEALWPTDLFTQGIGWVIIARFKLEGARVQAGIFLIDAFCLGAKLAVYEDCDGDDYRRRIRDHYLSSFPMVATELWCAHQQLVLHHLGRSLPEQPPPKIYRDQNQFVWTT